MTLQGRKPKAGDLIEIDRGFYKHWSVYVGDDYIVHITGLTGMPDWSFVSSSNGQAIVKKEPLKHVVGKCNYRVNNKYDKTRQVYPVSEIIVRANNEVDKLWTYHLFAKNCEHFATEIRYNEAQSDQAYTAVAVIMVIGFLILLI
ncbi:phospholipase A and acyltransferase 3-like isoform X2 [Mauremys mutica]|uniref:phospholipase A and acyltransferase 3-like isoform X2 n=1 Tax=Mauremys mutica TaxID=74926 RepID=UPI001D168C5F|nr:phospholipase A and acyltransferase 3-like isoform X2 [Mauremys mutica]XP_044878885.1 phospholipase A and acyltransferase 3-like isoform X2 [Mauremys mutica]